MIRDDPDLGLADSIFLEDAKKSKGEEPKPKCIPGGVHLGRRCEYLLRALRDYQEQQARDGEGDGDSPHRPSNLLAHHSHDSSVAAPHNRPYALNANKRVRPPLKAPNAGRIIKLKVRSPQPPAQPHSPIPSGSSSDLTEEEDEDSMDEDECKEAMRPVKRELKELRADQSKTLDGGTRGELVDELLRIGCLNSILICVGCV